MSKKTKLLKCSSKKFRDDSGATIAEFGACFTAFFFCVLIPCVNIVGFASSYGVANSATSSSGELLSKSGSLVKTFDDLAHTEASLKNKKEFNAFRLEPAQKAVCLDLAVEDLKGNEKIYPMESLKLFKKAKVSFDRSKNIYRYRLTTQFFARPIVDMSNIPLIGSIPILAAPAPIKTVVYREIEHPEFLSD